LLHKVQRRTTTDEAIDILRDLIAQIPKLRQAGRYSGHHYRWLQNAYFELGRIFGPQSGVLRNLQQLTWSVRSGPLPLDANWNARGCIDRENEKAFEDDLERAQGILESGIDQLERVGLDQVRRETGCFVAAGARKVFITHGHAEDVLRRVEDFVRALGLEPVVVKRGPSLGDSVDDLVERRIEECQAQIVLATADDQVDGAWQPRPNVIHEIGLGQRIFKDRIIYLKEDRCEFPSNVASKVWEPFARDSKRAAGDGAPLAFALRPSSSLPAVT
jgi:hypothetical protein